MQVGTTSYYYTRDHLGSIRELTNSSGAVQARYDYDPYGRRTKLTGSADADFGFTGHYYHQPSGMHLALYRAYDADLGRWIGRDPIGSVETLVSLTASSNSGAVLMGSRALAVGLVPERVGRTPNLYVYVNNNPMVYVDPSGLASTLRDVIYSLITAGAMTWQSLTGNPAQIQAPRTPTSERVADDERMRNERSKRPKKPSASMKCITVLYDPFDDLDFVLDYDIDKSFDENLRAKYGPPILLD
jgi:RHS repeat-associated protein